MASSIFDCVLYDSVLYDCVLQKNSGETSFGFAIGHELGAPLIVIGSVNGNSSAQRAGLLPDDVIVQVEGDPIFGKTFKEVSEMIARASSKGGKVVIQVSRVVINPQPAPYFLPGGLSTFRPASNCHQGQETQKTILTPTRIPPPEEPQPHPISIHYLTKWLNVPGFGFSVQKEQDGTKNISEVKPNTPAFASGIRAGSILCQVNSANVRIMSSSEMSKLIKESGPTISLTLASRETVEWLEKTGKDLEESMPKLDVKTHQAPRDPTVPLC